MKLLTAECKMAVFLKLGNIFGCKHDKRIDADLRKEANNPLGIVMFTFKI